MFAESVVEGGVMPVLVKSVGECGGMAVLAESEGACREGLCLQKVGRDGGACKKFRGMGGGGE